MSHILSARMLSDEDYIRRVKHCIYGFGGKKMQLDRQKGVVGCGEDFFGGRKLWKE